MKALTPRMCRLTAFAVLLVVPARASVIFQDNFDSYTSNTTIIGQGGWVDNSGSSSGALIVPKTNSGYALQLNSDQGLGYGYSPVKTFTGSGIPPVFASFVLDVSAIPVSGTPATAGGIFSTWGRGAGDPGADPRASLYIRASATPGMFNLGVHGSYDSTLATVNFLSTDFSTNTDYLIVFERSVSNSLAVGSLWVSPSLSESNVAQASAVAGDNPPLGGLRFLERRNQSGANQNIGIMTVDNLIIGNTFGDVFQIPEPAGTALLALAGLALLARRSRRN